MKILPLFLHFSLDKRLEFLYNAPVMKEETVDILEYNRIALEEELNMFMELLGDN